MYLGLSRNSPFPVITDDRAMRDALADREEIRFMKQPNGTTVCSYIISSADTFRDSFALEARGIVFDENGKIISRPLHKFFNVNERSETQFDAIDWTKVIRIAEKRDGSMIQTVKWTGDQLTLDGENVLETALHEKAKFTIKSKKSFTSDVVKATKRYLMADYIEKGGWKGNPLIKRYVELGNYLTERDQTAIFEFTSPTARIVIGYKEPSLHLLHVRDLVTGRYMTQLELEDLSQKFSVPLVDHVPIIEPIKEQVRYFMQSQIDDSIANIEGWVIQFENGDMVKLKTKWYMDRHHAFTFLRERDVAKMVLDESIDDLKSKLVGDGVDVTPIIQIEERVVTMIRELEEQIDRLFAATAGKDRKTIAIENTGSPLFSLLMQKVSGREPNVKEYFEKFLLKEHFGLDQINLLDSVAEEE